MNFLVKPPNRTIMNDNLDILDIKEFGRRCYIIRKKIGITQKQLAKVLGTTQHMISKIESGSNVRSPLILKVLWFFSQSVSLNRLFTKGFDEQDDTILNKQFAINSLVKAKLGLIKEELTTNFDKSKKEMCKQLDEAFELL